MSTRLFGTDGVSGVANRELTPELAFRLGEAAGHFLGDKGARAHRRRPGHPAKRTACSRRHSSRASPRAAATR